MHGDTPPPPPQHPSTRDSRLGANTQTRAPRKQTESFEEIERMKNGVLPRPAGADWLAAQTGGLKAGKRVRPQGTYRFQVGGALSNHIGNEFSSSVHLWYYSVLAILTARKLSILATRQ